MQIKPCNKSKTTNFIKVWLYFKKNLQVYFFKPQTYTAELFTSSIRCGLLLQPPSAKCHMSNEFPPPQECIYHFTKLWCRWGLFFPFNTSRQLVLHQRGAQSSECSAHGSDPAPPLLAWLTPQPAGCPLVTGCCSLASWGARRARWRRPAGHGDKPGRTCNPQPGLAERRPWRAWGTCSKSRVNSEQRKHIKQPCSSQGSWGYFIGESTEMELPTSHCSHQEKLPWIRAMGHFSQAAPSSALVAQGSGHPGLCVLCASSGGGSSPHSHRSCRDKDTTRSFPALPRDQEGFTSAT